MARQPIDIERIIGILEQNRDLVLAAVQEDINLASSDETTLARFMVTTANKSTLDTSRRTKHEKLLRAQAGLGSHRPYGYKADLTTIDLKEEQVVRDIAGRMGGRVVLLRGVRAAH